MLLGFVSAFITVMKVSDNYSTVMQVSLAQANFIFFSSGGSSGLQKILAEEPAILINRLNFPGSIPLEILNSCGEGYANRPLSKVLKVALLKGANSAVEITTFANTPESSKRCAHLIFEFVKSTEQELLSQYGEMANTPHLPPFYIYKNQSAKLISPPYVSLATGGLSKYIMLLLGLLFGIGFGLMLALVAELWLQAKESWGLK